MTKNEPSNLSLKIDSLCRSIFLTEDGRPKSAALLYSFCMSILLLLIYLGVFLLLPDFSSMLPFLPLPAVLVLEYLFLAVVGNLPGVILVSALQSGKRQIAAAYSWACILTVLFLLAMVILIDWASLGFSAGMAQLWQMLYAVGIPLVATTGFGTLAVNLLYKKYASAA